MIGTELLSVAVGDLHFNYQTKAASASKLRSTKMRECGLSPKQEDAELTNKARAAMTKHLENLLKKKALEIQSQPVHSDASQASPTPKSVSNESRTSSSDKLESNWDEGQITTVARIIDRLLFVSAPSLEEYLDTSTLDKRLRYILIRSLKRKLRKRNRAVASVKAKREAVLRRNERISISQE